ncbi:serine/threonine-protein kinase [Paludisphaera soli]|uniref:serine/threonine-protein kinase n=1 Tax=Paludisphaera soli TaxID=2712865 RepID=UPI0013EE357B|nr:serine/threonine-protein kinase [Paludisphaera soli]
MDPQADFDACPDDEVLRAFLLGDLPDAAIAAVGRHHEACEACESRARALDSGSDPIVDELRRSLLGAPPAARAAASRPGTPDAGLPDLPDYAIEAEPIGVGATGVVYKARHIRLGRDVALKMVARRPDVASRLLEMEAKAVAQLRHPNIVQIYDIGRHGDRPFLALEFVEGGSLEAVLREGPLDPRRAAEMIRVAAEAVDHAHRQGIVHCDLKPGNILIARDGVPKVADFGMAKWVETDGYWGAEGGFRGTPRYMAPEQAGGEGPVGPQTDVYSLGVILYEMLAGRPPHAEGTDAGTAREAGPKSPRAIRPAVPRDLAAIALKCLREAPSGRYPTAADLADDLGRFLAVRPVGGSLRGRRPGGRAAALVASGLAVAAGAWVASRPVGAPLGTDGRPSSNFATGQDGGSAEILKPVYQEDGSLRLGAAAASVAGDTLKFEDSFGNLGFWHGGEDRASWTFLVEEEADFRLLLEYANRNGEAENRYEVRVDGRRFLGEARDTGGWSVYRTFPVGEVRLRPGVHTIDVGPEEPLRGALFDLRAVVLAPLGS